MKLKDKVIVIIGGSQGIGKALAKEFINEGSQVVIASKNEARIHSAAEEIGAQAYVADVCDELALQRLATSVTKEFGQIDIWINSAGLFRKFPKGKPIDVNRASEMFDVNFFGAVFGSRIALESVSQDGAIINILSTSALDASRAVGAELYAASKWALRGYINALRGENSNNSISILSVYPGGTKTHLHDEDLPIDFDNFMEPSYLVSKIISNLKKDQPDQDLIIKRPSA